MNKKIKYFHTTISICLLFANICPIVAEEDFSDESTWIDRCSANQDSLTESEKQSCKNFTEYMASQSNTLENDLATIESERELIASDIQKYGKEISGYDSKINLIKGDIKLLNESISIIIEEIKQKEAEIVIKEKEVEELKRKIKERIVASQSSMRLNQFIDIIMGAKNFNDLIRRSNGLKVITDYDENNRKQLNELIESLNIAKSELNSKMLELENNKSILQQKQNEIIVLKQKAIIAIEESRKKEAELEASGSKIVKDLEKIKNNIAAISGEVDNIPNSSGFIRPVISGKISQGTWYYNSGGVHLGIDFVPGAGSPVLAVGNGVVILSADGCPTAGWLGNECGENIGGSYGGGNQAYLLTNISGTLYAIKYLHMQQGSVIATNSVVSAGDRIGLVGSSGNSSGNHVHVEVFKLGNYTINEYMKIWNGDLAFGAEWRERALDYTCDKKSAPCRLKPESVF